MKLRNVTSLFALSLLCGIALPSGAPATCGEAGPEVQINGTSALDQSQVDVSSDADGRITSVWVSNGQDSDSWGIVMMDPNRNEFVVNTYETQAQLNPAISHDPNGNFAVVWSSYLQDGDGWGVYGQLYNGGDEPEPSGSEFRINVETQSDQSGPRIDHTSDGTCWVVWTSSDQDGDLRGVFGRCFDGSGPLGSEFQVNSVTAGEQLSPDVAGDPGSKKAVVVWRAWDEPGVRGQLYDSPGSPAGSEFVVPTWTENATQPRVSFNPLGGFVVVFGARIPDGPKGIFARVYGANGSPQGPEFLVNMEGGPTEIIGQPTVAHFEDGSFVVSWTLQTVVDDWEVRARCFDSAGNPTSGEYPVNAYTQDAQDNPAIATFGSEGFLIAWGSEDQDGSGDGVFGRLFTTASASVEDAPSLATGRIEHRAVPNVFGETMDLRFATATSRSARVAIYNSRGRLVRDFGSVPTRVEGETSVHWDGLDGLGKNVPDGIYFYSIASGDLRAGGRLVRVR